MVGIFEYVRAKRRPRSKTIAKLITGINYSKCRKVMFSNAQVCMYVRGWTGLTFSDEPGVNTRSIKY